jgi:hypothetical protein
MNVCKAAQFLLNNLRPRPPSVPFWNPPGAQSIPQTILISSIVTSAVVETLLVAARSTPKLMTDRLLQNVLKLQANASAVRNDRAMWIQYPAKQKTQLEK